MLSSTVLFQNCSELESAQDNPIRIENGNGQGNSQQAPEFLTNRSIDFDNKVVSNNGTLSFFWSLGSTDLFYYETNHQATFETTLVTITGQNSVAYFQVDADECEAEVALTQAETTELSALYGKFIPVTEIRTRGQNEFITPGCSFPRLAFNGNLEQNGEQPIDFDIYFATPECAPEGEFFVTDRPFPDNTPNDPVAARAEIETYFNTKIDQVCGF